MTAAGRVTSQPPIGSLPVPVTLRVHEKMGTGFAALRRRRI